MAFVAASLKTKLLNVLIESALESPPKSAWPCVAAVLWRPAHVRNIMSFSNGKPEVSCAHLTKASESAECDRSSNHCKTVEKDAKSTSCHSPLPLWVLKSQCFATWCLQGKGVKAGLQNIYTPHCHIKPDQKTYILQVGPSALNHSHEVVPGNYLQVMFQITLSGRVSGSVSLSISLSLNLSRTWYHIDLL